MLDVETVYEARVHIEALQAENERLREALEVVVELHDNFPNADPAELWITWTAYTGGLRSARAALGDDNA